MCDEKWSVAMIRSPSLCTFFRSLRLPNNTGTNLSVLKNLDMKNTVLCSLVEFNLMFRGSGRFIFRTNILSHKPEHRNPHMHCCEISKIRKH